MDWKFIWEPPKRSYDMPMHAMLPNHLDIGVTYFLDSTTLDLNTPPYITQSVEVQ